MKKFAIGVVHKWRYPHRGRENLPKGDIAPKAYLVKWVTRGREGSKISKIGDIIHRQPLIKKNANHFNKEIQSGKIKKIMQNILSIFTIGLCAATYLPIPNSDLPAAFISAYSCFNTLIHFSYSSISEKKYKNININKNKNCTR